MNRYVALQDRFSRIYRCRIMILHPLGVGSECWLGWDITYMSLHWCRTWVRIIHGNLIFLSQSAAANACSGRRRWSCRCDCLPPGCCCWILPAVILIRRQSSSYWSSVGKQPGEGEQSLRFANNYSKAVIAYVGQSKFFVFKYLFAETIVNILLDCEYNSCRYLEVL